MPTPDEAALLARLQWDEALAQSLASAPDLAAAVGAAASYGWVVDPEALALALAHHSAAPRSPEDTDGTARRTQGRTTMRDFGEF